MEGTSNYTKIATFADERKLDRNAVTQYIRRHQKDFEGHITIQGRAMYADNEAIKILENKYPLPELIEVIRDPETDELRKQVIALQAALIEAQQEITHMTEKVALADAQKYLLEDREQQIATQAEIIQAQNNKIDHLAEEKEKAQEREMLIQTDLIKEQTERKVAEKRAEEAEAKVEHFRNAGLFGRIFWKG